MSVLVNCLAVFLCWRVAIRNIQDNGNLAVTVLMITLGAINAVCVIFRLLMGIK